MTINSCFSNGSFAMNKPNTKIKRWGIVVVQSLPPPTMSKQERFCITMFSNIKNIIKENHSLPFMMSIPQTIFVWQYYT